MKVIGIDPGKKGVIICLNCETSEAIYHEFKFDKNNFIDYLPVYGFLAQMESDLVVMEKVMGRGGMGATASFSFGFTTGQVLSLVRMSKTPFKHVLPAVWQKVVHIGMNSSMTAKEKSMAVFHNMCPDHPLGLKPKSDIVDAFLIAHSELLGSYRWKFSKFEF
jgi:hypothetical protein